MNKSMKSTKPIQRPLTEAEKKARVTQFFLQKRESFAISILSGICHNLKENTPVEVNGKEMDVVDFAVEMADKLLEKLYPLPEDESDKSNQ